MLIVDPSRDVCTVIVTVDLDAAAGSRTLEDLLGHARAGLDRFRDCDAYLAGAVHLSHDRTRLVQYSQWTDEAGYLRCRDDPVWDQLESTRSFLAHVAAGRVSVDARVFAVMAASGRDEPGR